eukprot:g18408.t1
MSKKAGKKAKVKVPEIDPNSPEWMEEVARKQNEAYDMVQRAMIRSQIEAVLATRDDLWKQRAELETRAKQQSEEQSDIYQYLRNKLKDNYVAIDELETKVSKAHDERLIREKQLLATIKDLNEERESEKTRLEERLATLDVELTAIKEYQENSEIYQQALRDMEAKIAGFKDALSSEVVLMNQQLEEELEMGRRDKAERRKLTKKAAAMATQEQLGPMTKMRMAQNKKMMSELRFQCCEVEKMHRAGQGLMKSNTHLLAQAASARHRVEELARRSHLLQRIIRYMHQKLQSRRGSQEGITLEDQSNPASRTDIVGDHQHRSCSASKGTRPGGVGGGGGGGAIDGGGGRGGENGALYKLAGMSQEERQQMLDLREELRREEVGISAAQTLVAEMKEQLLRAKAEKSRSLALKTDLARVLASCHEDPLLGSDVLDNGPMADIHGRTRQSRPKHHHTLTPAHGSGSESPASATTLEQAAAGSSDRLPGASVVASNGTGQGGGSEGAGAPGEDKERRCQGRGGGESSASSAQLPAIATAARPSSPPQPEEAQEEEEEEIQSQGQTGQQQQPQEQQPSQPQHQDMATTVACGCRQGAEVGRSADVTVRGDPQDNGDDPWERADEPMGEGLVLWPESLVLPPVAPAAESPEGPTGDVSRRATEWGRGEPAPRYMNIDTLKAVARLFLAKLQVSVEATTPRPPASANYAKSFPALMSGVSPDGDGGPASAFGMNPGGTRHHPRSSTRGAKRKNTRSRTVADHADCRNGGSRQGDQTSRGGRPEASVLDGSRRFGGHRTVEGSRGGRRGRGQTRSRGWADDATSWSDWHTTGIPSWDILEPSVRQTKRRRTRDAACQTLTYRELRDNVNAIPCSTQNHPAGWKNSGKDPIRPHGGAQQPQPRQRYHHHHNQHHHHVAPATRFVSLLNPPGSPLSSSATATVSTSSVYRVTNGGGIVHGAIVRGGCGTGGTGRTQHPAQRQAKITGSGGDDRRNGGEPETSGNATDAGVFPFRGVPHAGGAPAPAPAPPFAASTTTARPRNRDLPPDGHGGMLWSPSQPSRRQNAGALTLDHPPKRGGEGNNQELAPRSRGGSPRRHPETSTSDNRRLSPPVAQVTVSWGRGPEREGGGIFDEEEGVAPEVEVPSYTLEGREPDAFQRDREAEYEEVMATEFEGPRVEACGGGGLAYEPLSKGPDYRKGGLEQALDCCDCLTPPLRVVRIPLELLPPPAHSPPGSSSSKHASTAARSPSARSLGETAQCHSHGPSSPAPLLGRSQEKKKNKKNKFGFVGVTPEPDDGRSGASRKRTEPGGGVEGESCTARGVIGRGSARNAGLGREGGCGWESGAAGDNDPREMGGAAAAAAVTANGVIAGGESAGRRVRQREMLDLWVSAEALRLRVAMETVQTLRADIEEAPGIVCTIEICQGRPYLPGRLQRYPNVATSTGPYRAVHSYRVPVSGPRSPAEGFSLGGGGGGNTAGLGGSVFSPSLGGASSSAWRGSDWEAAAEGWVSVTDMKPSHWYNVRHRFSWRVGGDFGLEDVEEVVTATRHVHTEAYFPPVAAPPRPYAMLGCSRRQQQQQQHTQQRHVQQHHTQQYGYRRSSREQTGRRGDKGLVFHFRLRWGPGVRGAGRIEGRGFGQGSSPQEIEYILQESTCEPRSSVGRSIGDTASAKKAKTSLPGSSGGGGGEFGLGDTSPNQLRWTGERSPKQGAAVIQDLHARSSGNNPADATRPNATWSPGGLGGLGNSTPATADEANDPFYEQLFAGGGSKKARSSGERHGESGRGEWRTIRRTRKTRETVELPHASSPPSTSWNQGAVPVALRYRVGARRRDGSLTVVFSEVLEVPAALLARLYDIEEISATRQPLTPPTQASKKRTAEGARQKLVVDEVARGLEDEEAVNFLRAFEMSEDEDSFPTRVAWELQSEFWSQQAAEESAKSSLEEKQQEARLNAEAESIQCTLEFPMNTKYIAGRSGAALSAVAATAATMSPSTYIGNADNESACRTSDGKKFKYATLASGDIVGRTCSASHPATDGIHIKHSCTGDIEEGD